MLEQRTGLGFLSLEMPQSPQRKAPAWTLPRHSGASAGFRCFGRVLRGPFADFTTVADVATARGWPGEPSFSAELRVYPHPQFGICRGLWNDGGVRLGCMMLSWCKCKAPLRDAKENKAG